MNVSKVLDIIRKKSGNNSFAEDDMELAVEEIAQAVINYCNRKTVPPALTFTVANMAIDLLKYNKEINTRPNDVLNAFDPSDVATIRVGDTTITMGDKYRSNARSRTLTSHQANLDDIVMNYRQQLNRFRMTM